MNYKQKANGVSGQPQLWEMGSQTVTVYGTLFPKPDREISFAEE